MREEESAGKIQRAVGTNGAPDGEGGNRRVDSEFFEEDGAILDAESGREGFWVKLRKLIGTSYLAEGADDLEWAKIDLLKVEVTLAGNLVFDCKTAGEVDVSGHEPIKTCGVAFEVFIGKQKIFEMGFERVGLGVGLKVCFDGEGSVFCGQGEFLELDVGAIEGKGRLPRRGSECSEHLG